LSDSRAIDVASASLDYV